MIHHMPYLHVYLEYTGRIPLSLSGKDSTRVQCPMTKTEKKKATLLGNRA